MKKSLPTLAQTNLQNALAVLDDLDAVLKKLNRMRSLPDQATDYVTTALQLSAVATSHLKTCDEISTNRLLVDDDEKETKRRAKRNGHHS